MSGLVLNVMKSMHAVVNANKMDSLEGKITSSTSSTWTLMDFFGKCSRPGRELLAPA